jgi:hypothetical protein
MAIRLLLPNMAILHLLLQVVAPRLLLPHMIPRLLCYSTLLLPCVAPLCGTLLVAPYLLFPRIVTPHP